MTCDSASASDESPKDTSELPIVCLQTSISKYPLMFLVDSGSSVNLIKESVLYPGVKLGFPPLGITTLGGRGVSLRGIARKVSVRKGSATLGTANFLVMQDEDMPHFDGIIGAPFLKHVKAAIDYESGSMKVGNFFLKFIRNVTTSLCHCQITEPATHPIHQVFANLAESIKEDSVLLRSTKRIVFPAWHVGVLEVICPEINKGQLLLVEPSSLPNQMIIGGTVIQPERTSVVPVMNVTDYPITIKKGSAVAWAAHLDDPRVIIGLEEEFTED